MCPTMKTDTKIMSSSEESYERFILHHLEHYGNFTDKLSSQKRDLHNPDSVHINNQSPDSNDFMEDEQQEPGRRSLSLQQGRSLRTRQLLVEFDGERAIPRLREPLDLFDIPSSTHFQWVRWPVECQVIKETIQHIDWDPPEPEPFYQATGHERVPMPVGEKGNVVYSIDLATKTSYFTCSRLGGSRGHIKKSTLHNDQSNLAFESRFESGNLQKAVQVGVHDYELTLRTDMYTNKHTQWFYFRVRNMKTGVTYRFTIVNLMKAGSLYSQGMKPLLYSERAAWEKGEGWRRTGSDIRYYRNQQHQTEQDNSTKNTKSLHSLTWTCQFPYDSDTCFLAHCYPYTYSHLQHYLSRLTADSPASAYCKLRVLCRSLAGNAVHVLTVTAPGGTCAERRARRAVVVTARVHPGESNSSWMMQGFLDFLLGESDDARLLRDTFVFKVVPMLNPDGVVVGNYRCSLAGRDLNRNYNTLLRDSFPCVWHTRNMIKRLIAEREVVLYCDFHGHSRKNNVFMYGCALNSDAKQRLRERIFPLMMSKNAADKFSFRSCKFRVQKSKEGTGRVVMWRLGIRNSYTMESTFGGSTLGKRKETHFTTRDLKSLGYYLCDTLLDFCDPDPTKTSHCLAELGSMLKQEVKERLGREVYSDGCDSVSISDIESSTSGSNSTESNGLPAHLMNRSNETEAKKKRLRSRKERNRMRKKRVSVDTKVLHRNVKNIDPVLPTNDMVEVSVREKIVAVVREKREKIPFVLSSQIVDSWIPHPTNRIGVLGHVTLCQEQSLEKSEYLKAAQRCNRARAHPTQPPIAEEPDDQKKRSNQLQFDSSQPLHPGAEPRPAHITAIQQRNPHLPVCSTNIRAHISRMQQQPTPFNPDHMTSGGMRGRLAVSLSQSQWRVTEFPSQGLQPCRSSNFYPDKSRHQQMCPERQGHAARVSISYYKQEALTFNSDALQAYLGSPERGAISGSDTAPELDLRRHPVPSENPLSQTGSAGNSFLPDLKHRHFKWKSHGRLFGDKTGAAGLEQVPSKREIPRGRESRHFSGGEGASAASGNKKQWLAKQNFQVEEIVILPQMSSTTNSQIDHPPLQRDRLQRLQKLSLARTSRFHSIGTGTEEGASLERTVSRPSGSAPPRSTAQFS
ncbi:hypothetical protein UPYG_G00266690 [Umbra pygmaea]|uniref:Cytosolic carboxypeptidase 2 n=1 Tax=Umbra pygmaea TaxID=75934 RepID=A0ABD0WAX6_UMBPY